ncbi:hypothetical protein HMPREF9065_00355 [Aggregatibacter sp. oral taxon 458 str. W10330]|nr:hypothetical protein HMPREF9065_00355 [Aggregatibacter sp. oral taxon 458 str. W10330]
MVMMVTTNKAHFGISYVNYFLSYFKKNFTASVFSKKCEVRSIFLMFFMFRRKHTGICLSLF